MIRQLFGDSGGTAQPATNARTRSAKSNALVRGDASVPRVARDASRVLLESGGALKLASRRKRSKCEASLVMPTQSQPIVPPAPKVHAKDLPLWRFLPAFSRNTISTLPDYAFDVLINRRRVLGIGSNARCRIASALFSAGRRVEATRGRTGT